MSTRIPEIPLEEEGQTGGSGPELTGHELIRHYVNSLDGSPGVYRMLDEKGQVLYVGKARHLKNRVSSYAQMAGHSPRIERMIRATASMMFLTTTTETEALLLEQNLIKQLKPRYNVLLRDDKSFPNILVTADHDFPQIKKHRGAKKEKGEYYGPFASATSVNRTLNQLQKIFQLRNCSDAIFASRSRPCLQYQINRCSAPCVGYVEKGEYASLVADASRFLKGKTTRIQKTMAEEMSRASAALEFERAAALRDRIRALTDVQASQGINPGTVGEGDVIALFQEGGQACVQVFFIRAHQNWGNRAYFPRTGGSDNASEMLRAFIGQFYANKTPPARLILSDDVEDADLIEDILSEAAGRRVRLHVPKRGEQAGLVAQALRNARESLARRMAESASQMRLLEGLAQALDLPATPQRIEIYDNSHIQGSHSVGAMVVAGPEGFIKSSYRKFNMKLPETGSNDDFAMMREMISRRFKRLIKEDPDRESGMWPDLLLIDGGKGQVSSVKSVLDDLGISDMAYFGVAKGVERNAGREEFHAPTGRVFALRQKDPVLYFVQRLRDEAHRFAIGAHRQKRGKTMASSALDSVPGVGAARKRALLRHFGSARAVQNASVADLKAVDGISGQIAETIHGWFQDNG